MCKGPPPRHNTDIGAPPPATLPHINFSNVTPKQITRIRVNTTLVYFNSFGYPFIYAACFGLYLDYPQACQYKNHRKENTMKI